MLMFIEMSQKQKMNMKQEKNKEEKKQDLNHFKDINSRDQEEAHSKAGIRTIKEFTRVLVSRSMWKSGDFNLTSTHSI